MDEQTIAEAVMREILEVLARHNLSAASAALTLALPEAEFESHFPLLITYHTGHFHRVHTINGIPLLFHAQRHYPFDEIIAALAREVLPQMRIFTETLQRDFPALTIACEIEHQMNGTQIYHYSWYAIRVSCRFSDDLHANYNVLQFTVSVSQSNATSFPHFSATIGWLVDEESGNDWGLDVRYSNFLSRTEYDPHHLAYLRKTLPTMTQEFRQEIERKLAEEE